MGEVSQSRETVKNQLQFRARGNESRLSAIDHEDQRPAWNQRHMIAVIENATRSLHGVEHDPRMPL
jgi:hypothetical protein